MIINQPPFYFGTIRKLSVAFGSLFNNIYIQRFDEAGGKGDVIRTIRVPLSYSLGEKWYIHRKKDIPAQEAVQTRISLPRIGYELKGFQYDARRKLNTLGQRVKPSSTNVAQVLRQLNPVPYDFLFDVGIAVKNIDDGLQIIEQVLPNFNPSFNLVIKDIPELDLLKDVPVILAGVNMTDTALGSFEETRILEWTLSFIVKGYLYPVIKDADIIRKTITSIYKDKELTQKSDVITVRVDPIDASYDSNWSPRTDIFDEDHLDSNGDPLIDSNGEPLP